MSHRLTFETLVANERPNLLRFCAYLTNSPQVAEDLTQETLLTAWQRRHTITDPSGLSHWLKAIARNVCRHWQRSQACQQKNLPQQDTGAVSRINTEPVDDFDVEIELERDELITLLDRALGLLPSDTRGLLIQHYIEALPHAELAAQAGLSIGAVGVRLHRGKLALRQALITDFRDDAVAYGLITPNEADWVETRIWCFVCGQHKLQGYFNHTENLLRLRCPGCCDMANENDTIAYSHSNELEGIKAFKPAFSRGLNWVYNHYLAQGTTGTVFCQQCGEPIPIRNGIPPDMPKFQDAIYDWCDRCNSSSGAQAWNALALALPQVQQFWRDHPRMAALPPRRLEIASSPAVLTGYESVTDGRRIEVAFSSNTFEVIYID